MDATLPGPDAADSENVVWLLSTAQSLWAKGERPEALRWVERAANAARDEGNAERASHLGARARALSLDSSGPVVRTPARRALEQTMQSNPAPAGDASKQPPVVVSAAAPAPVAAPPVETPAPAQIDDEVELSSSDLSDHEPGDVSTRRFDYPEALAGMAMPSGKRQSAAPLPDGVLPAIRVWIVGGVVIPAVGPRPAGAADAMLVSSAPGVDLVAALARKP